MKASALRKVALMPCHCSSRHRLVAVPRVWLASCLVALGCQSAAKHGTATLAESTAAPSAASTCASGELHKFLLNPLPSPVTVAELGAPQDANASSLSDLHALSYLLEVCLGSDDSVSFQRLLKGGPALVSPVVIAERPGNVSVTGLKEAVFGDTQSFKLEATFAHQPSQSLPQKVVLAGRLLHGTQAIIAYEYTNFSGQWLGLGQIGAGILQPGELASAGLCAGVSGQAEPSQRLIIRGTSKIVLKQCTFNSGGISGSRDMVVGVTVTDTANPALAGGVLLGKDKIYYGTARLASAAPANGYVLDLHRHHGDCDLLFIEAAGGQYAVDFGRGPTTAVCPLRDDPGLAGHDPGSTPDGHALIAWRASPGVAWQSAPLAN